MAEPFPTELHLHQRSRILEIVFDDGRRFELPFEYLRVHSPSAEVTGHGATEPLLVVDKENIEILEIKPVGQYGISPRFSDGHTTGIYTWTYLYELGLTQTSRWQAYRARLAAAGHCPSFHSLAPSGEHPTEEHNP